MRGREDSEANWRKMGDGRSDILVKDGISNVHRSFLYLELLHADTRQGDCLIILGRSFLININILTFRAVLLLPSVCICIARAAG